MKRWLRVSGYLTALALAIGTIPAPVMAAGFPDHPVTLVVQYPAGGGIDITGRLLAKHAEKYLGQKIVVVNVVGGGGTVGNTRVATSPADGYTIGIEIPAIITDKFLLPDVGYTPASFDPIALINTDYGVIDTKKGGKFDQSFKKTFADTKRPELITAMSGLWTSNDWALLVLKRAFNLPLRRVGFQGGAPALQAVLAQTADVAFNYPSEIEDYVKQGTIAPLAIAGPQRNSAFPDTPTLKELGFAGADFGLWRIVVVPHGTPAPVREALSTAFLKALNDPALKEDYAKAGLPWAPEDAAKAAALMKRDQGVYESVISKFALHSGSTP